MEKIKSFFIRNKIILLILFIISLLIYGYAGTNNIINIDGVNDMIINNKLSDCNMYISVGRWGWAMVGFIFNYYPSTFLCLVINSVLFSISGILFCELFDVKNNVYKVLISTIFIAFPVNTYAYLYSSWQFMIGLGYFLCVFSLYKLKNYRNGFDALIIGFLIAFCTSLYQEFLAFIMCGCILLLIMEYFKSNKIITVFKAFIRYLLCGLLGVLIYLIIVKISLLLFGIELSSYQGASSLYNIDFKNIIDNLGVSFVKCLDFSLSSLLECGIRYIFIFLFVITFIIYLFQIKSNRFLGFTILIIMFLISPRIIMFIKPDSWYHVITLIPYSIFYAGILCILYNMIICIKHFNKSFNYLILVLLGICSFSLVVKANNNFVMAKQITDSSFAYLNRLQMRIESTSGYDKLPYVKEYYFYKKREDGFVSKFPFSSNAFYSNSAIKWTFLTYDQDIIDALNILGINVINAKNNISDSEKEYIKEIASTLQQYPNSESIFIYNDIVVIVMEDL